MWIDGQRLYEVRKADGSLEQIQADAAEFLDSGTVVFSNKTHEGQTIEVLLAIATGGWQQVRKIK